MTQGLALTLDQVAAWLQAAGEPARVVGCLLYTSPSPRD